MFEHTTSININNKTGKKVHIPNEYRYLNGKHTQKSKQLAMKSHRGPKYLSGLISVFCCCCGQSLNSEIRSDTDMECPKLQ